MIVGFQGEPGAFSEGAAYALLGDAIQTRGYATFDALLGAVSRGEIEQALLPRENTIAGVVAEADAALVRYPSLVETREITYSIEQCLIGAPGATVESVRTVFSHPVALAQCSKFFAAHPQLQQVAADDTAASVRRVVENGDVACAAIASATAAQIYGATIFARGVGDSPDNRTRFSLIERTR